MNRRVESITEIDLQAYVDNELAADRRMEVQAYLRCHEACIASPRCRFFDAHAEHKGITPLVRP